LINRLTSALICFLIFAFLPVR